MCVSLLLCISIDYCFFSIVFSVSWIGFNWSTRCNNLDPEIIQLALTEVAAPKSHLAVEVQVGMDDVSTSIKSLGEDQSISNASQVGVSSPIFGLNSNTKGQRGGSPPKVLGAYLLGTDDQAFPSGLLGVPQSILVEVEPSNYASRGSAYSVPTTCWIKCPSEIQAMSQQTSWANVVGQIGRPQCNSTI